MASFGTPDIQIRIGKTPRRLLRHSIPITAIVPKYNVVGSGTSTASPNTRNAPADAVSMTSQAAPLVGHFNAYPPVSVLFTNQPTLPGFIVANEIQ